MPFRIRPSAFLFLLPASALLAGCGMAGLPAQATVTTIDRTCDIIETITRDIDDPRGSGVKLKAQEMKSIKGECKSAAEWDEVRTKRTKLVQGTAAVHVDYRAPQDGSYHSATLNFTGRDDEFYELKAGDTVAILVSAKDPTKIRKA